MVHTQINFIYTSHLHTLLIIVYAVSDAVGKFYPVSFMNSSHETQNDFERFYEDLINEVEL